LSSFRPTLFHMLERLLGKRVLVVVERDFGYEGELVAVSHHPPGIWISEAEAIVLRSTVVNPIPQVVSKEKKHELFLHLNSVLRIEAATESGRTSERK
jgi:small nuclear ribonucleoprotein (snRNP)-like protein